MKLAVCHYLSSNPTPHFGGNRNNGANAGVFYRNNNNWNNDSNNYGCRAAG